MAIFPREQSPQHPRRILINETNRLLKALHVVDGQYMSVAELGVLVR
jgi:hypothetical protein